MADEIMTKDATQPHVVDVTTVAKLSNVSC